MSWIEHTFEGGPSQAPSASVTFLDVHQNAQRVEAMLRAGGATGEVVELDDSARTAAEAAASLGVEIGAIVKSLVFAADGLPVIVLASGDHQVDTAKVARVLGVEKVKRADADLVRAATGFPIGGVAPVAHPEPLPTVVDEHLSTFEVVWAAAGTPHAVFPTTFEELVRLTAGTVANVAADG
jgi:prolyl-tRNA editing enzyme YbaK/EbsC (Cys-tRNA(Pro) deacylase)